MKIRNIASVLLAVSFTLAAFTAEAVPSFAKNEGKNCSYCHNAWPQLNHKGRTYKELGYRLPDRETLTFKEISEERSFPISAVLTARPIDKKDDSANQMRALHEVEIIVAGEIGDGWSAFFELEAEDEDTNARGFEVGISNAVLAYNYNKAVNVQFNWGPTLWADPYGFLGDSFRLTRGHVNPIDNVYGGTDGKIRSTRQNVTVTGRPLNALFYSVGLSGEATGGTTTSEGKDASTLHARLAFDITRDIMIGGFVIDGDVANGTSNPTEYQRLGVDAQVDIGSARVQLAVVSATDDDVATPGAELDNDSISLQAYFVMKSKSGAPTWVPLVRFDSYDKNNGTEDYNEVTVNIARYITQNSKAYLEYWDRSGPTEADDADRITLQLAVGF